MSKKIIINHKPSVKKMTKKEQYREKITDWNLPFPKEEISNILTSTTQNDILQKLYMCIDETGNILEEDNHLCEKPLNICEYELEHEKIFKIYISEIKQKINSYKNQDKTKGMLNKDKIISLYEAIELLVESKLKCSYCKNEMNILYPEYRCQNQWTLDRVDNDIGHHKDNCVISCLKCNLQKKRTDDDDFRFTKQLKIIKTNE